MTTNKKITTSILALSLLLILALGLVFYPFLNIKKSIGLDTNSYKDVEIKVVNYNPFETKIYYTVKDNDKQDQTLIYYQTYKRNSITGYELQPIKTEIVAVKGYSETKLQETLNKNDLTQTNPDEANIINASKPDPIIVQEQQELQKPKECQDVSKLYKLYKFSIEDFVFLNKSSTVNSAGLILSKGKDFSSMSPFLSYGESSKPNYKLDFNISDGNVMKVILEFSKDIDQYPDLPIVSAKKVFTDCSTEDIPLPDKLLSN